MNPSDLSLDSSAQPLLEGCDWSFPVPITYGPGRLAELGEISRSMGIRNPMIVTDCGSRDLPFIAQASQSLRRAGLSSRVFGEISTNPGEADVARSVDAYRSGGHDAVIAIGGGSGMDGGKATALMAHHDLDLWQFDFEREIPTLPTGHVFPKLICVPSTAGTGAETESTAMVTHAERGMKLCVWHPDLKPSLALLDPEITLGLPSSLTAWTGIDAMVHAIEAYCVPNFHPMCDGAALQALELIGQWLPVVCDEPGDVRARGGMQVGACLAGVAFLKGLGLVHAMSHAVGAEYDTHHGLTNAVLLPAVLRFNAPAIAHKIPAMASALAIQATDFDSFYYWVCDLLDKLEIPARLCDLGVPEDAAARLAAKALSDTAASTNPRGVELAAVEAVLLDAMTVGR